MAHSSHLGAFNCTGLPRSVAGLAGKAPCTPYELGRCLTRPVEPTQPGAVGTLERGYGHCPPHPRLPMPDYRRTFVSGGAVFITLVTYQRSLLLSNAGNVERLRDAIARLKRERPFEILGAVVLPDHIHFLWQLPPEDTDYSYRVSRMKVLFTWSLYGRGASPSAPSASRRKHRESDVWQRRFWEHTIRDEEDLQRHLDYIHFNPVKHGLVTCPHLWQFSSFQKWVAQGLYAENWGCVCEGSPSRIPNFKDSEKCFGE